MIEESTVFKILQFLKICSEIQCKNKIKKFEILHNEYIVISQLNKSIWIPFILFLYVRLHERNIQISLHTLRLRCVLGK